MPTLQIFFNHKGHKGHFIKIGTRFTKFGDLCAVFVFLMLGHLLIEYNEKSQQKSERWKD